MIITRHCRHHHAIASSFVMSISSSISMSTPIVARDIIIQRTSWFSSSSSATSAAKTSNSHSNSNSNSNSNNDNSRIVIKDMGEGIHNIQLNRPNKCNALDIQMFESIGETISKLQTTDIDTNNMRCIILSGNGRAFCTGLDVPAIMKPTKDMILPHTKMNRLLERPSGYDKRRRQCKEEKSNNNGNSNNENENDNIGIGNLAQDVAYLWRTIPIPVIAVLHGMCYGGGLQIALGADIRIATPSCKLSIMESKWGLIPDMSASVTLRELIPIDVAKELTFTGRIFSGVEAKELGLVTKVVIPADNGAVQQQQQQHENENDEYNMAMEEAMKLAKQMVKQSPDAIAAAKLLYQTTYHNNTKDKECLDIESKLQMKLLPSWNQFVASSKNFGIHLSYMKQQKDIGDYL